tara:strand:- start:170 stop:427 length:258 start_codon:yes stop_codon:yes gene_type:complete
MLFPFLPRAMRSFWFLARVDSTVASMVVGDKVIDGNCHGLLGEELKISLGQVQNVVDEVLDVDFLVLVRVNRLSKQFVELLAPLS